MLERPTKNIGNIGTIHPPPNCNTMGVQDISPEGKKVQVQVEVEVQVKEKDKGENYFQK
jgi:hypothetical protein